MSRSTQLVCEFCLVVLLHGWCGWGAWADSPPLRSVADLLATPTSEVDAGVAVCSRGVVTLAQHSLVIDDGTAAIWVHQAPGLYGPNRNILGVGVDGVTRPLALGDEVEIEGVLERGGFAPTVTNAMVRILGSGTIRAPVDADVTWLFHGGGNASRVEVGRRAPAIVQGCRDTGDNWNLILDASDRKLVVKIDKMLMPERPDHLVDAAIRVVGVTGAVRNSRGQLVAPMLVVADPHDIVVVDPPRDSPFDAPFVPLAELGLYRPQPESRRRIRTEGVVTCHVRGRFCYLQDGLIGVRVDCPTAPELRPGDRVRVAGFVDLSQDIARLVEAIVERIGHVNPPEPEAISPDEIREILLSAMRAGRIAKPTNYSGVLVRFPATLVESKSTDTGWTLTLTNGRSTLPAQFGNPSPADVRRLRTLPVGGEVTVTGVAQVETRSQLDVLPSDVGPETGAVNMLLRSAADIRVIRPPPVWSARLLGALAAVLAAVAGIAIAVIAVLRREVARQTAQAVAEAEARQATSVEYAVAIRERSRIAADLHDTLLQTMTGIGYQLQLCKAEPVPDAGTSATEHLVTAERLVNHAARQLRSTVWSLRSMPDLREPLPEAIAAMLRSLVGSHAARVEVTAEGQPCRVHETVARQLLLIVQEAVLNAMHHGHARSVQIRLTFAAGAESLDVVVADDGSGFVVGTQPGPAEGHFGLQGMHERAESLAGHFSFDSLPGRGTTIRLRLPYPGRCPKDIPLADASLEEHA